MNKELLKKMKARQEQRLEELRGKIESGELREADIEGVQQEIDAVIEELNGIKDALADNGDPGDTGDGKDGGTGSGTDDPDNRSSDEPSGDGPDGEEDDPENRSGMISQEQRAGLLDSIKSGLEARNKMTKEQKEQQIRSAFANFVVGNISETEARSLGLEAGNGSVTVPDFLSREIITYAQEENFLRRLGTGVSTTENIKYPILVEQADAQGHKKERTDDMPETDIAFDEIELTPTEFDALATVTKKLLARTGLPIEQIVMDELKKAYVRKETEYMVHGNETDNLNDGALAKKSAEFTTDETNLYDALVKMKNTPVKAIRKKARWVLNTAAITQIETMKTEDGWPLLRPLDAPVDGCNYKLLGYLVEEEDAIDEADPNQPVYYFGDFSKFYIQDVVGSLEIQKLVELFARTNRVGFRIWNLLDAQLIYSPFEVPIYKYLPTVGGTDTPDTPK
ncbi:phage major capsid protein [Enterococcus hirae]